MTSVIRMLAAQRNEKTLVAYDTDHPDGKPGFTGAAATRMRGHTNLCLRIAACASAVGRNGGIVTLETAAKCSDAGQLDTFDLRAPKHSTVFDHTANPSYWYSTF